FVDSLETAVWQIRLAADLHQGWMARALEAKRNLVDGPEVGRDAFADRSIAARGAFDQHAVPIRERNRGAVDLELAVVAGGAHVFAGKADEPLFPGRQL